MVWSIPTRSTPHPYPPLTALLVWVLASAGPTAAATFTVTQTGDSGAGSLRQAILDANGDGVLDTIEFDIPGAGPHVIQPSSALPAVSQPVVIDGTTEPGYAGVPLIVLDGSNAGANVNGLRFSGGGSTVRALVVNNWANNGLRFDAVGGNTVEACYVGTDAAGTSPQPNGANGIFLSGVPNNVVGGTTAAARNVISGNTGSGLRISGAGATGNRVEGNYIGVDATGTQGLGNGVTPPGASNILMDGAPNNTIGGATAAHRNIISGATLGNALNLTGAGADGNRIQNNYVGTNAAGTAALPNGSGGLLITNGAANTVVEDNLLSGNQGAGAGVRITSGAHDTLVRGNLIGPDVNGTTALGNFRGVLIAESADNTIGGPNPGDGNVISGNPSNGVAIQNTGSTGNLLEGNLIGTDISGNAAMGNGNNGVTIREPNNTVRGNVIAASAFHGIQLLDSTATGNVIEGNLIGTDIAGTAALPNLRHGISISGAGGNTVRGGNVISGNSQHGIHFTGAGATGNVIQGNFVGTTADGSTALGNSLRGVLIEDDASDNTLGGLAPGQGNVIGQNGSDGIWVFSGTGNEISGNSIFGNGLNVNDLGIDLGGNGVTANDPGDSDTGANGLQNFPLLTVASSDGCATEVIGTLNSAASTAVRVELFASAACDASGQGEGAIFLGSGMANTDAGGDASFSFTLPVPAAVGAFITATATDPSGNTSEFSACLQVAASVGGGVCLFLDGFESGDTGAWSLTVP